MSHLTQTFSFSLFIPSHSSFFSSFSFSSLRSSLPYTALYLIVDSFLDLIFTRFLSRWPLAYLLSRQRPNDLFWIFVLLGEMRPRGRYCDRRTKTIEIVQARPLNKRCGSVIEIWGSLAVCLSTGEKPSKMEEKKQSVCDAGFTPPEQTLLQARCCWFPLKTKRTGKVERVQHTLYEY